MNPPQTAIQLPCGGIPIAAVTARSTKRHTEHVALVKVLLIEDEAFTRSLLAAALAGPLLEVHAGSTAKFAMDVSTDEEIDVAVLDLDLGAGPSGIDIAHALRAAHPRIGLVMLTSFSDPRLSSANERALPIGTRYMTKSTLDNVNKLVTLILQSRSQPMKSDKAASISKSALTDNQVEVLRAVAAGDSNAAIAKTLGISEKAVEHTITRINELLGTAKVESTNARVQLVRAYSSMAGKTLPS